MSVYFTYIFIFMRIQASEMPTFYHTHEHIRSILLNISHFSGCIQNQSPIYGQHYMYIRIIGVCNI